MQAAFCLLFDDEEQLFCLDGLAGLHQHFLDGAGFRRGDARYYSRTIRLLKKLLENPELLERPLKEEVEY